jgi:hypothetical protein
VGTLINNSIIILSPLSSQVQAKINGNTIVINKDSNDLLIVFVHTTSFSFTYGQICQNSMMCISGSSFDAWLSATTQTGTIIANNTNN